MQLTEDQISLLQSLELINTPNTPLSKPVVNTTKHLIPLITLTGVTFLTGSGLILLKNQPSSPTPIIPNVTPPPQAVSPTQVPKSIQHYLLSSQTSFSEALNLIKTNPSNTPSLITHLNNAILAASSAIQSYPNDSRGYEQRGRIYISLIDSRPQYLNFAITDYLSALNLNPSSSTNAHTLASLYTRQGNIKSALNYLGLALSLDPTNPQNFYDLAKLQQQTGQIPQALATYQRLLPLVTDPTQRHQLESETQALQNLASQNPATITDPPPLVTPTFGGPLLQAQLIPNNSSNVIIASPETVSQSALTSEELNTNALSGQSTLKAGEVSQVISTNQLKPNSQVYLTVVAGGKNQTFEIKSKTSNSFTVGLTSPIAEDIQYKWWIVN